MSAPRPIVDAQAHEALDAIDACLSIATSVRDGAGAVVDEGRNETTGLFDALIRVVETGEPFYHAGGHDTGGLAGDRVVDGVYDLGAVRHGDGYVSAWRVVSGASPAEAESPDADPAPASIRGALAVAQRVVGLVRLE